MNKTLRLFLILCVLLSALMLVSCRTEQDFSEPSMAPDVSLSAMTDLIDPDSEVRGVWIASVFSIDYPSSADLSADELKTEIDDIISVCTEAGLNTVYFQVRPTCDALYDSDIFPVSRWLSSTGTLVFDPLDYFVEQAHSHNIFLYAWVNPLRISVNTDDVNALPDGSPAREHPEWVVEYASRLYFDAGIPEVRSLIVSGVSEIVKKYDVDGVVFDDFFYPYPVTGEDGAILAFEDGETYETYGNGEDLGDWRRSNINTLIHACCDAVHAADADCQFGVAPFGVWANNNGTNGGSDSANLEAYSSLYCDALAWAEGGYVDFLSPQLYWRFDNKSSPYDVLLRWWNAKLDKTGVKLIVSHAAYQYGDGWTNPENEMAEQISFSRSEKMYRGSVFYGYDEIRRNESGLKDEITALYDTEIVYTNIISNEQPVTVTSPEDGAVTFSDTTYLIGSCDPYYPLTLDGVPVSMTKSGYFNLFVTLTEGENVFVFEQNGETTEYHITYKTSADSTETAKTGRSMDEVGIESVYPSTDVATSDETVWVQCVAPVNATVSVDIGGAVTELDAIEKPIAGSGGYTAVLYGGEANLPTAQDGKIRDCGNVRFTMQYYGETYTEDGGDVRVLGEGARLCVRATGDYTDLKITESSLYYNDYTVQSAGMTDYADSLSDGFYHLRMGGYVYAEQVEEITTSLPADASVIRSTRVELSERETHVVFSCVDNLPYNGAVDFEKNQFVLTFFNVDSATAAELTMSENPLFSSCEVERLEGKIRYRFTLYSADNFYGYDLFYDNGETVLVLRNPLAVDLSSKEPLKGKTIALDAGHGGYESGARGCRENGNESDVNLALVLAVAEKLRALGAEVTLTRDDDTSVSLSDRIALYENYNPDLLVSLHQNSVDYSWDATTVRGTLGLYCMDSGYSLARYVGSSVASALGRWYQDTRYQMLAVCRNPKFPSCLIEVGYMTSVEEYEDILSPRGIERCSDGIVNGILSWYGMQNGYLAKSDRN